MASAASACPSVLYLPALPGSTGQRCPMKIKKHKYANKSQDEDLLDYFYEPHPPRTSGAGRNLHLIILYGTCLGDGERMTLIVHSVCHRTLFLGLKYD